MVALGEGDVSYERGTPAGDDGRGAAARHTRHARMTPSIKGPNQITMPRLIKSLKLLCHD